MRAAKQLGLKTAPCLIADDLTDEQIKAYRLVDNKTAELAEWDFSLLEAELAEIADIDMELFGFEFDTDITIDEPKSGSLADKYIEPPFSILDTRQGRWQDRKRIWSDILKSGEGRAEGLLGQGLKDLAEKHGANLTGTSIFDPVLCEVLLQWFCPRGGKVIDPFAGGSVRGMVSALMGNAYTGMDLSAKQIEANERAWEKESPTATLDGGSITKPQWICGDSREIDTRVDGEFDFLLTCPPYADLEVYSDDPRDISNMEYADFRAAYREILHKAFDKLKENAYAAIVVGEVRDKKGYYYNFVGDTIEIGREYGLQYYNECILVNQVATAALRADKQFSKRRKVVKTHQNVLVFLKGKETEIDLAPYEYSLEGGE